MTDSRWGHQEIMLEINLDFIKYFGLLGWAIFIVINIASLKMTQGFSPTTHTLSKSILIISNKTHELVFRMSFLIKALLDVLFSFYIAKILSVSFISLVPILFAVAAVLFGSLAFFVEGKQTIIHRINVYVSGTILCIAQIVAAVMIGNITFLNITIIVSTIALLIAFWSLYRNKTNFLVQLACAVLLIVWQIGIVAIV